MNFTMQQIAQIESIKYAMQKEKPGITDNEAIEYALEFASEILGTAYWLSCQAKQS